MCFWAQKTKLSFAKTLGKKPKSYQHIFDSHKAGGLLSSSVWQHWKNIICHVICLDFLLPLNANHGHVVYQVCPLHLINSLQQWLTEEKKALSGADRNSSCLLQEDTRCHAKGKHAMTGICIQPLRVIYCQAWVPVIVNCCIPCDYKIKKGVNCSSCQSNCFLPW